MEFRDGFGVPGGPGEVWVAPSSYVEAVEFWAAAVGNVWSSEAAEVSLRLFLEEDFQSFWRLAVWDDSVSEVSLLGAFWNPKIVSGVWDLAPLRFGVDVLRGVARFLPVSVEMLVLLASAFDSDLAVVVAGRPMVLPVEVLLLAVRSRRFGTSLTVVQRPSLPVEVLEVLADPLVASTVVRVELAARSDLPVGLVEVLAGDRVSVVREVVAGRSGLPVSVVRRLVGDSYRGVLEALVGNLSVSEDLRVCAGLALGV